MRKTGFIFIYLALAVVTLGIYAHSLANDFTNYDDTVYITRNPEVKSGFTVSGIAWAFRTDWSGNWHPLTWLSHMADCQLYGLRPAGHHLTNILLHTASTLLLLAALQQMTGAFWRSALVAALFGWHPLHVESVAWVAERKDVLCAFFWMLTMLCYARYARESKVQSRKSKVYYALTLACFALGLMAKPMIVTLPFVLLLLDYWPLNRINPSNYAQRVLEKFPMFILALVSCAVTMQVQDAGGNVISSDLLSLKLRMVTALVAYGRYLEHLVWPTRLAVFYPYLAGWPAKVKLGSAFILAAVTWNAWRVRRSSPYLLVGWLWFLGTLVPVIGLVQVGMQSMADRYTYLPSIGFFIMVAWLLGEAGNRRAATAVAAAALVALLGLTWVQVRVWKNSETLWRHALACAGESHVGRTGLGMALSEQGRIDDACEQFEAALKLNPVYYYAQLELASCRMKQERWQEAAEHLQLALQASPGSPEALEKLKLVNEKLGAAK